jgi:hypothetical protein
LKKALRAIIATSFVAIVLSVAGPSTVMAVEEWDAPSQATPSILQETFWYPSAQLMNWKDFGAAGTSESGGLFGLGATGRLPLPQGYFVRPSAEIFGGNVGFKGNGRAGSTLENDGGSDYLGMKVVADFGRALVGPAGIGFEPIGGLGFRYWHRDIKPGNGSMLQRWTSGYLRAGLRANLPLSKASKVYAEAGAAYPVFTRVSVSGLGVNDTFTPGGLISAFAEVGADVGGFRPSIYYEGFRFDSDANFQESQGNTVGFRFGIPF